MGRILKTKINTWESENGLLTFMLLFPFAFVFFAKKKIDLKYCLHYCTEMRRVVFFYPINKTIVAVTGQAHL